MMRLKDIDGQLQLDIVDIPKREPFNCKHELKTVDIGGGKSFCELMGSWTNCREMRRCVYERFRSC